METIDRNHKKYEHMEKTDLEKFAMNRSSSFTTQFKAIFIRNLRYHLRNPRSFNGLVLSGLFTALLCLALFFGCGKFDPDFFKPQNSSQLMKYIFNLKGFAFLLSNNISF
jgi:hypothetical protein